MTKKPILIILCGLPFSGKSTLAKYLAEKHNFTHIDLDKINSECVVGINKNITEKEWKKTYRISYERLDKYLNNGISVVYDATNFTKKQRDVLRDIADKYKVLTKTVYVSPPKEEVITRWQENRINNHRKDVSDKDFAQVSDNFEKPTKDENPYYYYQTTPINEWINTNTLIS